MHTHDDKLEPKAVRRLELITGTGRQRAWSREETLEIVGPYHGGVHRGLGRPPIAAWHEANPTRQERRPRDSLGLLLDFLPFETRVLRRTGIHLHNICYWSDGFAPWIGRGDDKLVVKYDLLLQDRIAAIVSGAPEGRSRLEAALATLWAPLDDPGAARPVLALWIDDSGWRCPSDAQHVIGAPVPLGRLPISCASRRSSRPMRFSISAPRLSTALRAPPRS